MPGLCRQLVPGRTWQVHWAESGRTHVRHGCRKTRRSGRSARRRDAEDAIARIGEFYAIEAGICATPAAERRRVGVAQTIRYALSCWTAPCRYLDHGRTEIDNNTAERAIRPVVASLHRELEVDAREDLQIRLAGAVGEDAVLGLDKHVGGGLRVQRDDSAEAKANGR